MSKAEEMRNRLNKKALARAKTDKSGKTGPLSIAASSMEELIQVSDWIEMPEYFQRCVGNKGVPCGHITQIYGDSDTGKTTIVMDAMIRVQKAGGVVYLIDSEHKFDFERFETMGGVALDVVTIVVDSLEEAWNAFDDSLHSIKEVRDDGDDETQFLLVWDSVPASVADKVLDSDAGKAHVSVEAKINNVNVRRLRQKIKKTTAAAMFINHHYMTMPTFGYAKEVLKGGSEMYFMSSLIVKTRKVRDLTREINKVKEIFGITSALQCKKGHLGPVKATTEFHIAAPGILSTKEELDEYKANLPTRKAATKKKDVVKKALGKVKNAAKKALEEIEEA